MVNPKMQFVYPVLACLMLTLVCGSQTVNGQDRPIHELMPEISSDLRLLADHVIQEEALEEDLLQQKDSDRLGSKRSMIQVRSVPQALLEQTSTVALALIQASQLLQDQGGSENPKAANKKKAKQKTNKSLIGKKREKNTRSTRVDTASSKTNPAAKQGAGKQDRLRQQNVEIRAYGGDIQLRTFSFSSNDSPSQNRQVIVEMKKGTGSKNERVISGVIAEESWIDSRSGAIQFYNANELLDPATVNQFWIGVQCSEIPKVQSLSEEMQTVLAVEDVVPDSAASEAGIEVKDVICAWNERQLNSVSELVAEIQANQSKLATVSLIRDGKKLDVELKPRSRTSGVTKIHTIFAPSTELEIAEERIGQLKAMILANDIDKDQLFRFVVVGPGVNFGQGEIELQLKPDLQNRRAKLTRMIDRVAEKKFSVMFRDDNVRLLDSAELDMNFDMDELVPEQIWQSFDIGSNGHSLSFSMIAPQVLSPMPDSIRIKANRVQRIERTSIPQEAINGIKDLAVGRLIFESPHQKINIEQIVMKEQELQQLRLELEKVSGENENLKAELEALKILLKSKK